MTQSGNRRGILDSSERSENTMIMESASSGRLLQALRGSNGEGIRASGVEASYTHVAIDALLCAGRIRREDGDARLLPLFVLTEAQLEIDRLRDEIESAPKHTHARVAELEEAERLVHERTELVLNERTERESAEQDAASWREAYTELLDRFLNAPPGGGYGEHLPALHAIALDARDDPSFGITSTEGRREYVRAVRDAAMLIASNTSAPPLATVRVILNDGTMIRVVVLGKRGTTWLLSAPGMVRFYSHSDPNYHIHPDDLAVLEGKQ